MKNPFLKTLPQLLEYKGRLTVAAIAALVSALSFGAGITVLPVILKLFLRDGQTLRTLVDSFVAERTQPGPTLATFRDNGLWVAAHAPEDRLQGVMVAFVALGALTIFGAAANYLHELLTIGVVLRLASRWRARIYHRLLHAPMLELIRTGYSDYISRLTFDTKQLSSGYRAVLSTAVEKLLKAMVGLVAAFIIDWQVALVATLGVPVLLLIMQRFGRIIKKSSRRAMRQRGRIMGVLGESLSGQRVVKVHNAEGYERRRFARANRRLLYAELRSRQARALAGPLVESLTLIGILIVATGTMALVFKQEKSPENAMAVLIALGLVANGLRPLTRLHTTIQEATAAAERIETAMLLPNEPVTSTASAHLPKLPRHSRSVRFEDVTFGYTSEKPPAVAHVTLEIEHGQMIAVVGGNGSGKTTLLSMLPRLIAPDAGRVLIDGTDIATVNLRSVREQMGVVTQHAILFEGSIADNIAYGRRHVPMQHIVDAAKTAYADEFVQALPQGYDTMLAEGGEGLSGGQRQRLCIARAILRDPAILILDEATSQIDADSEAKINQAIRAVRVGRTIFIIAHRLSTVIDADRNVDMAEGSIADQAAS